MHNRAQGGDADLSRLPRSQSLVLRLAHGSYRVARRLVIASVGVTVVLVGLVMVVTPGPALVVIPVGLAILAIEFAWARRLLRILRIRAKRAHRDYRRGSYGFRPRGDRR